MKSGNKKYHTPRVFPYFKIQIYDEKFAAWVDIQKTFYELSDLADYAEKRNLNKSKNRIMIVESEGSRHEFGALQSR